jgi:2-(1,2-epoxy-1,2-dihydrophenyl)acetyl-CoA isomerase
MSDELRQAVLAFDADDEVGAIVLTGAGRGFCSGADVTGWGRALEREADPGRRMEQAAAQATETWTDLWARVKPTVVAMNGDAIGAGLTITLGCDYRIAAEHARISMRFAAMGVMPELESTRLLPHIIGLSRALDVMLTGELIPAPRAAELGIVNECVPADRLLERAIEKASQYARIHPQTTRAVKQLVWANVFESDTEAVKRRERLAFAEAQRRPSHREAVRAFLEKREPDFYRAVREAEAAASGGGSQA